MTGAVCKHNKLLHYQRERERKEEGSTPWFSELYLVHLYSEHRSLFCKIQVHQDRESLYICVDVYRQTVPGTQQITIAAGVTDLYDRCPLWLLLHHVINWQEFDPGIPRLKPAYKRGFFYLQFNQGDTKRDRWPFCKRNAC